MARQLLRNCRPCGSSLDDPLERLLQELRHVSDEGANVPYVNKIEVAAIKPLIFNVIDQEPDVRRSPLWLHGTEIGPEDVSAGKPVAN
jgi:hypothetical protein